MRTLVYRRHDALAAFGEKLHCPAELVEWCKARGWSSYQPRCAHRVRVHRPAFSLRRPSCTGGDHDA